MLSRRPSAPRFEKQAVSGKSQLTLAKLILLIEATLRYFARPLAFAVLFIALSWLGIFSRLYPWAHLAALVLFAILFFNALGNAQVLWRRPTLSLAMRRVEEASGLSHRPMDTVTDRPFGADAESHTLWQQHVMHAREQMKGLRWPRWNMDWNRYDPYRLRYALGALLVVGFITGWGALGGRLIAAINPALGKMPMSTVAVDAWITPPEYTHLPPIMIATPAGDRFQDEVISVPEGSTLRAHLAEKDGETPSLKANGQRVDFTAADGKDFEVTATLSSGKDIAIERGWTTLGSWKVRVVPDTAPEIAFSEVPSASERKDVRVAYDAKDDYGVTSVMLRVTPRQTLPGFDKTTMELPLASPDEKDVKRVDYKDLTAEVWAGMPVDLQLVASDAAGHKSESDKVTFTLPERIFFQPVARMLIGERKRLLANLFDPQVRIETANLMAGLAKQPESFGKDPAVMMALRAGAVRLVLDHERDAAVSAEDILWQTAVHIEDGTMGVAEQNLRQAQQELADALDRNASEKDVQAAIDRLHQALGQYLAQLSTRMAAHPAPPEDLRQIMGSRTNMLTPQDLNKMLDDMRNLSAAGSRDQARAELSRLKDMLENMTTSQPELTKEQQQALQNLKALHDLAQDQQKLMDQTFQDAQKNQNGKDQNGKDSGKSGELAKQQGNLQSRLHDLMNKAQSKTLPQGADAMQRATSTLKQGKTEAATASQGEALKALRDAEQSMADSIQNTMFALPGAGGSGAAPSGNDPFGRDGNSVFGEEEKAVTGEVQSLKVREILNEIQRRAGDLTRPKTERDYIERLLQNF